MNFINLRFVAFLLFFRLPEKIVEIYWISLTVCFTGGTAGICLAMLMIQANLAQVFILFVYVFLLIFHMLLFEHTFYLDHTTNSLTVYQ